MADARMQDEWSRTASILAWLGNINKDPKKGRPFKPEEFMPAKQPSLDAPKPMVGVEALKTVFIDRGKSK